MRSAQINEFQYYAGMKGIYLYPTESQREYLDRCIEGYMIVYNWSLDLEFKQFDLFQTGQTDRSFLSFIDLQTLFVDFRKTHPLLLNLPSHSMLNAAYDMVKGYELFFKRKDLMNKPKFKSEVGLYSSFHPRSEIETFYFKDDMLRIEGLRYGEMIKTSYHSGFKREDNIKFIDPTITRNNRTGQYSVSFKIVKEKMITYFSDHNITQSDPIGVDVNKKIMYACSNGMMIPGPDTSRLEVHLADINRKIWEDRNRLKEAQSLNPDVTLSNSAIYRLNQRKQIYERITNLNKDYAYKGSLEIIRCNPKAIVLETLDIKKIMSYHYIADDLQFHPLGLYQRILQEQAFKYNIPVVFAPALFESSNYCSECGYHMDNKANIHFNCPACGAHINRDLNAAINLQKWYISTS